MNATVVKRPENLKENRKLLSPPIIEQPLYQCAVSVTVLAYEPNATIDVDVSGTITSAPGGFPVPNGVTVHLPAALVAGQRCRARPKFPARGGAWDGAVRGGHQPEGRPGGPP